MADTVARKSVPPISITDRPIYAILLPVPVVCFLGAVVTDLAYLGSGGNFQWVNFSTWLLAAGLLFGLVAGIILLIDTVRGAAGSWLSFGIFVAAWLVELVNSFVHARDGWTAVAGTGLILSIVGALLIMVAGWLSRGAVEARP